MDIASSPHLEIYGKALMSEILAPGDLWGGCEVIHVISVSLLGTLYRVKDQGENRCLHVFPSGITKDPAFSGKIEVAVEAQRKLEAPELLKPIKVICWGNSVGVLFEDFEGETLAEVMRKRGSGFSVEESTRILKRVSTGLVVARKGGLDHLTISGEMILYGNEGKIKTYGYNFFSSFLRKRFEIFVSSAIIPIIKVENPEPTVIDILSPEIRNAEEFDERADIFGLGLLAYYLLTGKNAKRNWVLPSKAVGGLSEGWDYLISKCLESEAEDRFATLELLIRNLDNVDACCVSNETESLFWRKLEKIPLPERVVSRYNAQTLQIIRLVLLGVLGVLVVGSATYCYELIFGDPVEIAGAHIVEVGADSKANLILYFEQPRVLVKFIGAEGGSFLVDGGVLRLQGDFREFKATVEAPKHEMKRFSVTLNKTLQERKISLNIAWGALKIVGIPGSRIDVVTDEGKRVFLALISESGEWEAKERLFASKYHFAVSLRGHEEKVFNDIELSEKKLIELNGQLEVLPASLKVQSYPEGVPVYINGIEEGTTPLILEDQYPGAEPLTIEVKGEGLRARSHTVEIQPGEENLIDFGDLEVESGTLSLAIKRGEGTAIPIEELARLTVRIGKENYEGVDHLNQTFPAGPLPVSIEHPDYLPYRATLTIDDLKSTELTVVLIPRPGVIEVSLDPDQTYRISIDGLSVQPVNNRIEVKPRTEHTLRIVVRDYLPYETRLTLTPNEQYELSPRLKRILGPTRSELWAVPYLDVSMGWIPEGQVEMGSSREEQLRLPNEDSRTQVRIRKGFWVGQFEVTQKVYAQVMGKNPSEFKGENHPVESVSYDEAVEFCRRLTIVERRAGRVPEGYAYRLPTEAEWEYFCRAGTTGIFTWGNTADSRRGNFQGNYPRDDGSAEISTDSHYGTVAVGTYRANQWGLHDLHGNVREWVLDGYNDRHPGGKLEDFYVKEAGVRGRTVKGGGWGDFAHRCRIASREPFKADGSSGSVGFRIALAPILQ